MTGTPAIVRLNACREPAPPAPYHIRSGQALVSMYMAYGKFSPKLKYGRTLRVRGRPSIPIT
jgi:hypothetical protein